MRPPALERWLLGRITQSKGATRVELRHRDEDGERIVSAYELEDCKAERLAEIAGEVLADASGEAELAEVRMSFLVYVVAPDGDGERAVGSVRVRCDPKRIGGPAPSAGDPDDAEDLRQEPSRNGVLEMVMKQNAMLFRELAGAPARQRAVYEDIVEFQNGLILSLRSEVKAAYAEMRKLITERESDSEISAEVAAELEADAERRSHMFERFLTEGGQLLTQIVGAAAASAGGGEQGQRDAA